MTMLDRARAYFRDLQARLVDRLQALDGGASFGEDLWDHRPGRGPAESGGGRSRVVQNGAVFEKAGVNFSSVAGTLGPRIAARLGVPPAAFRASGVSAVIHPKSPRVPTAHMNLRYLEVRTGDDAPPLRSWFGGGADLTPYFLEEDDARSFHAHLRRACDRHDPAFYPRFKKACDDYFRVTHRDEGRGVGGIFFDDLTERPEETFAFARDAGEAFLLAYPEIVERRGGEPYGEADRAWQLLRRGRYVEFNLVYDRGTLFGLETGGRVESILMSLPPLVSWAYDPPPPQDPKARALLEVLREPREWT